MFTMFWATVIILGILITIHEYGHFMAARSVGVQVERFSIGMPPRFLTIESIDNGYLLRIFFFKRSEGSFKWKPVIEKHIESLGRTGSRTEYVIALLPLGGYVKMAGMIQKLIGTELRHELEGLGIDIMGELGTLYEDSPHLRDGGSWQFTYMYFLGLIIGGGTSQIQKNIISERGLGLPREPKVQGV